MTLFSYEIFDAVARQGSFNKAAQQLHLTPSAISHAIAEMEGTTYGQNGHGIPVLTYEEMAGLVLGYDPWELGMQMHQVDVEPLLDKMGVEYDPAAKYLGRNGKYIGKPESAVVNCCPTDTIYDIRE